MRDDLKNLIASCLVDGGTEKSRITTDDAAVTLQSWKDEGGDVLSGLTVTAEDFAMAWNAMLEVV